MCKSAVARSKRVPLIKLRGRVLLHNADEMFYSNFTFLTIPSSSLEVFGFYSKKASVDSRLDLCKTYVVTRLDHK